MGPHSAAVTALILLLPAGGCCTMSQGLSALFCGPRPPLPRRSHLTARQALDTFVAAVATDDSRTIWETVGPDLKKRWGIGRLEWEIGWTKIKADTFGIHLVDQAERSKPVTLPATATRKFPLVRYRLSLAGTVIEVLLRQYSYKEVITLIEGTTTPEAWSKFIPDIAELMEIKTVDDKAQIKIRILGPDWTPQPAEVLSARVTREWLIYDFTVHQD